jgi:hypothetical protein
MSEMSFPAPEPRLRAYVESILASSSVPSADREEIAEELYGHLWQRWQDAIAAGANASEAVETAIRSFGEASQLGREMTGAYHSRLYATTIGVLLPAVTPPPGRLWGFRRLRLLLVLVAIVELVLLWIGLIQLTPIRAAVFASGAVFALALDVLAFRAFGRGQRWALRYCQFVLAVVLIQGAESVFAAPSGTYTFPMLGIIGVWMLRPAIGAQMADWFSSSRPIGRALAIALVAAVAAGYLLPYAAGAMPDPTQVSASDLDLQVSAVCTRDASGGVTAIDVNTRLRWSRLDLFPYGLGQGNVANSWQDGFETGASPSGGQDSIDWRTAWISIPSQVPLYLISGEPQFTSPNGSVDGLLLEGPPQGLISLDPYVPASDGIEFAPGGLHAGWTYDIAQHYQWQNVAVQPTSTGPAPTDPLVTVRYAHLDRFVVQALASCDRPGSGVPMALPYPWASQ